MEYFTEVFGDFWDPKKRIFFGYLFLSLLLAGLWLVFVKREGLRRTFAQLFDRKVFLSTSARADYKIFVINRIFTLFISPLLITQMTIATAVFFFLHGVDWINKGQFADTPRGVVITLFTLSMFVFDDFTKFLLHRWMHRWPLLWAIHKVHHSAETLTPVTVYRVHPLEGVLYGLRSVFVQGAMIPVFLFFFGGNVDLFTVVGVNALVFVFHVTGSNLRHSHIDIHYWPWLERILISPAQHQLHHSTAQEHYDKNFGVALALWDGLFGSLHLSEKGRKLRFGLDAKEASADRLWDIYLRPFKDMFNVLKRRLCKLRNLVTGWQKRKV
ncbi:sterol desaturase family protein [Thalassobius sp. MITS945101]|uniref:sterol desaturase family protein n=1 Tax=Thalassobius sp. MITS945101 TaxID=3096994 RepID=UPI00399A6EA7